MVQMEEKLLSYRECIVKVAHKRATKHKKMQKFLLQEKQLRI